MPNMLNAAAERRSPKILLLLDSSAAENTKQGRAFVNYLRSLNPNLVIQDLSAAVDLRGIDLALVSIFVPTARIDQATLLEKIPADLAVFAPKGLIALRYGTSADRMQLGTTLKGTFNDNVYQLAFDGSAIDTEYLDATDFTKWLRSMMPASVAPRMPVKPQPYIAKPIKAPTQIPMRAPISQARPARVKKNLATLSNDELFASLDKTQRKLNLINQEIQKRFGQ